MKILLTTCCFGYDGSKVTHSLVDLDLEDIENYLRILDECRGVMRFEGFYCVELFDYSAVPVDMDGHVEDVLKGIAPDWYKSGHEIAVIPDGFELELPQVVRITASTVRVMPEGIMWHYYDKHTDNVTYETAAIPWTLLQEAVATTTEKPDG